MQGSSGLGKSSLFRALLEASGYSKIHGDTNKHYYEITGTGPETAEILLNAFHEGSVVIIDELNIGSDCVQLLHRLLDGVDDKGETPKNPGFMVLATQNQGYYTGRNTVPSSLLNRLHVVNFDDYTPGDLQEIATELFAGTDVQSQPCVDDYLRAQEQCPSSVNPRTFFHAARELTQDLKTNAVSQENAEPGTQVCDSR